jgi:hypothetical protein
MAISKALAAALAKSAVTVKETLGKIFLNRVIFRPLWGADFAALKNKKIALTIPPLGPGLR